MEERIRALVVEDDPSIAEFVRMGLGYEGFDVRVAADGRAALAEAEAHRPEVVVLDWMLPGLDGIAVCRRLRALDQPAIIMLTARDAVADRVAGLEAGADDYVVKPFHFEELVARIQAVLRRRGAARGEALAYADLTLDRTTRDVARAGQPIALTPREFDVLALLMEQPRRVFTKQQLLDGVWGYDHPGDDNIVEVYIGYLRDKLGDRGPRSLIRTIRGVGYTLRAD